jgi:uncharacterized radical SAM protein YgiQ
VTKKSITDWLPTTLKEVKLRGWERPDIIIVSGDAYVDHPSFGTAVISRILEKYGFKVAIISQPNWRDDLRDFKKLGEPRLFFGVTSGCMDSMVNHYTAAKRLRSNDAYTPGGAAGFRPDYATVVYSKILKNLYPDVPVVIGGIEASLRRITHYDYWSDTLKPSILFESEADILVYGMGEKSIVEIANCYNNANDISYLRKINQIAYLTDIKYDGNKDFIELNSHEICLKDKKSYLANFRIVETQSNLMYSKTLVQKIGEKYLVINPPYLPSDNNEIDEYYDLPYTRMPHPKYEKRGLIPAYEMIKFSVNIHRGCFGGCAFCTISAHQGKFVSSRSEKSILNEIEKITNMPDFKGYISDLGGPSANMYRMKGIDIEICKKCQRFSCIYPGICKNLNTDHKPLIKLYNKASKVKGIKKVFIGSGIRYDLFINKNKDESIRNSYDEYCELLVKNHISGRLKVAPEHNSDDVLKIMRKPSFSLFKDFKNKFDNISRKNKLNQQIVPYFISSHPGSKLIDMALLALETKDMNIKPEQVQDFTPTPMTLATEMYYSEIDPYSMNKVFVAKNIIDKKNQNRFFFWYKPENHSWIRKTLERINRKDVADRLLPQKSWKGKK